MGKAKVKLELIPKEKSRNRVFKKRKDTLIQKLHDLTVLCGVHACVVIKQNDNAKPEIWPKNRDEVHRMINIYEKDECSGNKTFGLNEKIKKVEAKYPTQLEGTNSMNEGQLREFAAALKNKAANVKSMIESLKTSSNKEAATHPPRDFEPEIEMDSNSMDFTNQDSNEQGAIDQNYMINQIDIITETTPSSFLSDMNSNSTDFLNEDSDSWIDLRDFDPNSNFLEMDSNSMDFTNQDSNGDYSKPGFSFISKMDSNVFIHERDFEQGFSFSSEMNSINSNSTDFSNQDSDIFIHERDFEPDYSFLPENEMNSHFSDFSNQGSHLFIDEGFRTWLL